MICRPGFILVVLLVAQAGCDPVPVQYPPGSIPYPNANNPSAGPAQPQFQISGCQRGQHAWGSIMEGVAMGSSIAGPYGAGAGLIIGLIKHAVTFESECAQLHAKIGSEQLKDQQLEAAIEQELERQRALETRSPAHRQRVLSRLRFQRLPQLSPKLHRRNPTRNPNLRQTELCSPPSGNRALPLPRLRLSRT